MPNASAPSNQPEAVAEILDELFVGSPARTAVEGVLRREIKKVELSDRIMIYRAGNITRIDIKD